MAGENSWPVEGYHDRHISASEPRMFPGMVSRHHRRQSSARAETEEHGALVVGRKRPSIPTAMNGLDNAAVEASSDEE